jgi:hypothetical protein
VVRYRGIYYFILFGGNLILDEKEKLQVDIVDVNYILDYSSHLLEPAYKCVSDFYVENYKKAWEWFKKKNKDSLRLLYLLDCLSFQLDILYRVIFNGLEHFTENQRNYLLVVYRKLYALDKVVLSDLIYYEEDLGDNLNWVNNYLFDCLEELSVEIHVLVENK